MQSGKAAHLPVFTCSGVPLARGTRATTHLTARNESGFHYVVKHKDGRSNPPALEVFCSGCSAEAPPGFRRYRRQCASLSYARTGTSPGGAPSPSRSFHVRMRGISVYLQYVYIGPWQRDPQHAIFHRSTCWFVTTRLATELAPAHLSEAQAFCPRSRHTTCSHSTRSRRSARYKAMLTPVPRS